MSKLKRARRYIGKTIRGEHGGEFLVEDVVFASNEYGLDLFNDPTTTFKTVDEAGAVARNGLPFFYHPGRRTTPFMVFKGQGRYLERVNSRVRHEIIK